MRRTFVKLICALLPVTLALGASAAEHTVKKASLVGQGIAEFVPEGFDPAKTPSLILKEEPKAIGALPDEWPLISQFSGLASPYNHGNQPSLHISWLFNFSGRPSLTQKWTRLICDEFYGTTGEHGYGYGQDEDQGQLGAWYVLASMGLFDVQGGTCARPTFQIGSPLFDRITIHSPVGKDFTIRTVGNAKDALYVQSASLNGEQWDKCWLYRDELYKGGELVLTMGTQPSQWGAQTPPPCPED